MKSFPLSAVMMMVYVASVLCQTPDAITYQTVVRDGSGNVLINQSVSFRLSILQESPSGTNVFCETHSKTTNEIGLATLEIGRGMLVSGSFSTINWGSNSYYLQTEMDPAGGSSYSLMGTSQFLSVPYALYAKSSGGSLPSGTNGQTLRNDGTSWVPNSNIYNDGSKVGVGTTNPSNCSIFETSSSNKGLLPPRMTGAQRDAIASPVDGLMVYCTNCGTNGSLSIYVSGSWITIPSCTVSAPTAGTNTLSPGQIIWNWNCVSGASGYKWNSTPDYWTATDLGTSTSKTETGTACNTAYTRYIWAYSACGVSSPTILTETTPAVVPISPTAGTHISTRTSITWNWNTVSGATGYKWNTTNDSETATEMGTATTKIETGLSCDTEYTRYAWAYNGCGYSTPVTLTQSTLDCWICGDPFTINHVAGIVAPVTKTVTYGTVTNIPGETSKCWITRNLGASQQAASVSDATEASAGWYWQFNLKQGYKHDGTTRTPNTTWISSIDENSNWISANDPCVLELGTAWRIPTYIEWYNVDNTGGWTNWIYPWESNLKIHAAGNLLNNNGNLFNRGMSGLYWSSTQVTSAHGWYLLFNSGNCFMNAVEKAYGFSLRCLRE